MAKPADRPGSAVVEQTLDQTHSALNSVLSTPWNFFYPTQELYSSTVDSAKHFLDFLATSVSDSQHTRQQSNRKRKRAEVEQDLTGETLQLKQLYVNGFTSEQIWAQAIRILDSTGHEVDRDYVPSPRHGEPIALKAQAVSEYETPEFGSLEGSTIFSPSQSNSGESGDDFSGEFESESEEAESHVSDLTDGDLTDGDVGNGLDEGLDDDALAINSEQNEGDVYIQDPFGLNDGFFSIDDFNKQSENFEQQDAKGGRDDESDDEEIDWHLDPLASGSVLPDKQEPSRLKPTQLPDDDMSDSSDDDGPTFGNANTHSASDPEDKKESYANGGDNTSWMNTSDIKYSDFFAPPPRKVSAKRSRALPKTQPDEITMENDMERAMADVRRDLFGDDISLEEESFSNNELDNTQTQRSTHEKQRARIADEIRRLEAANVAKKEWMLAGEARAAERPINSLIEEDLDFERIGKPVTVVTNELTEDIEELVKRRILAKEFDEVIRRRPGALEGHETRRERFELDDTKPQQSLAELYETDHLRATDPNYVDPKNQKLMREHAEITNIWKEISSQLDTLCNWHYKPKAPQASINVVTDVATIMMEDARPTVSGASDGQAALAPQEIYAPGDDGKVTGEVVLRSGASVAKEEMTREEKARRRRQQKMKQKNGSTGLVKQNSGKAAEKQQIVSDLKKGDVKVIGKQGEITDVHGSKVGGRSAKTGADTLKL